MKSDIELDVLAVLAGAAIAAPFLALKHFSVQVPKKVQADEKAEAPVSPVEEPDQEPQPGSLPAPAPDEVIGLEKDSRSAERKERKGRHRRRLQRGQAGNGAGACGLLFLALGVYLIITGIEEELSKNSVVVPTYTSVPVAAESAFSFGDEAGVRPVVSVGTGAVAAYGCASEAERAAAKPPVTIELKRQHVAMQSSKDKSYFKNAYYGTLKLGTPAVAYTFVFDTGSGHLVLPSAYCHSKTCKAHKRYRRSASRTAKDIDSDGGLVNPTESRDQINVQFGTGDITGVFVEDVVCMDDGAMQRLAQQEEESAAFNSGALVDGGEVLPEGCARMRFIAATEMSEKPFESFMFDGILGLGLSELSQAPEFNFIHVLSQFMEGWGSNMPHTFAVFLGETWGEQSELALGGWDDDHLDGNLHWNAVHRPELGHWVVRVKSVRVDGEVVDFCREGCKAVVDTGTSLMAVPPAVFPEIYELMRHPAALDGLCQGAGPQLHIELEHFTVTMDPEDYARPEWYKETEYEPQFTNVSEFVFEEDNGDVTRNDIYCRPMLMSMDLPEPIGPKLFILGEPVLRKYYTVYDADKKRVGFGRANHAKAPTASSAEDLPDDETWFFEDDADDEA